jgi:hypothetical protein
MVESEMVESEWCQERNLVPDTVPASFLAFE